MTTHAPQRAIITDTADRPMSPRPPDPAARPPLQLSRRRTTLDVAVQLCGWPLNILLGIVAMVVLVRALGAQRFGEWSTIFAVADIAMAFVTLGLDEVSIRQMAAEPERESQWLAALVTLRTVLTVPVGLTALAVMLLTVHTGSGRLASVMVAGTILLSGPGALRLVFQLRVRNDVTMAVTTVQSVLWTAAVLAIAAVAGGIVALAGAFLAVQVLTTAAQAGLALRRIKLSLRGARRSWAPLARLGTLTGIIGLLTIAYGRIDQVIVFHLAGARAAGLYAAPYRILDRGQFLPISVLTTLFPIIASSWPGDPARVRRLLQRAAEYLAMATLPVLAFTIVAAGPVVRLLFGPAYAASTPALPVLMGALVAISFGYLFGYMVVVLRAQRRAIGYAALALVVNVGLNLALVPHFGFVAAAWVTLATEVLVNLLLGRMVLAKLGIRPQLGRFARIALASALSAAAVVGVRAAGGPLAALIAVAGLSYLGSLALLRALALDELIGLLRREPV